MLLVTGATGNAGAALIARLSERGVPLRAFVRNRAQARAIALPGVDLVEGDFNRPETFAPALDGADSLLLLIPSSADVEKQQRDFVDAARHCGVKRVVKLSQFAAGVHAPGRFQRYHGVIEQHIRESGMEFTFLRPNLFMQGLLMAGPTIASQGAFYVSAGQARVSLIDVRDIASVAARVRTEAGHVGKTYDLTGPEALTHAQLAERLSQAIGRQISFVDIPPEAMREALLASGLPAWQAEGIVEDYAHYRRGEAAVVTSTVEDLTGKKPITFAQFARDYAASFGAQPPEAPSSARSISGLESRSS
jgi:uncharacterized protein YbjT (DUF2867 family)